MSPALKRSLSSTGQSISPPALRRKLPRTTDSIHVATTWPSIAGAAQVCICSWNVNGIGPLLQKQLSFDPGSLPPLRALLKRHQWPQLLCLQEVKISPKDTAI